jgi:hypothetical protein
METVAQYIARKLAAREFSLAPPAPICSLLRLENLLNLNLSEEFKAIYSEFDGTESMESETGIIVWSVEHIIEEKCMVQVIDRRLYFAFADFGVGCQHFYACLEDASVPVFCSEDALKVVSSSFVDFFINIVDGHYDLINDQ